MPGYYTPSSGTWHSVVAERVRKGMLCKVWTEDGERFAQIAMYNAQISVQVRIPDELPQLPLCFCKGFSPGTLFASCGG